MGNIRIDANAAQALAEFDKLVRKENEVAEGQDKIAGKSRSAAAEERRLGNLRAKLLRETDTAQERFQRRLDDVRRSLAGTGISEQRLGKIRDKLHDEYLADLKREKEGLEDVEEANDGAFGDGAITKVAGFLAGIVSVRSAVQLVTKELEAQQDLIDRANAVQITVEQSRSGVRRNLAGASDEEIKSVQDAAEAISNRTGISEVNVNVGLEEALSASGLDIPASIAAVTAAANFVPDSPQDIGLIAGTLLDLAKATGTNDANVNLGLLSSVGAAGRVVDPRLQASNLAPGIIGTLAFGGDFQTSGAALAALTNAGADFKGARTATGLISLAEQLEKFDLGNDSFDSDSFLGRLRAVQGSSELQSLFLSDASFEKQVKGVIRDLLTDRSSVAATQFNANLGEIGGIGELGEKGRRAIEVLDVENALAGTAELGRAFDQVIESERLKARGDQLTREQIEGLQEILQRNGQFATESEFSTFASRLNGDGVTFSDAAGLLRQRASALRAGETVGFGGGFGGGGSVTIAATEEEKLAAERLSQVADRLLTLIEKTGEQTSVIKRQATGIPIK